MKKNILLALITMLSLTNSYAQEKLQINTTKSELKWSCDYTFSFSGHFGFVKFKEGYFIKTNNKITGGEFIIDLNTIISTDMDSEKANTSLANHLKNEDFFEVNKFPTAKLVITSTNYHNNTALEVKANLTIKGITQAVKFQGEINFKEKTMSTKFKIDRTLWNITYNSAVKNNAISDAIGFHVILAL